MPVLDALIYGLRDVIDSLGNRMPRRSRIKFTTGVTDDPEHDMIVVDNTNALDGTDREVCWDNNGVINTTPNLIIDVDGNVNHDGVPVHNEDYDVFKRDVNGIARPQWEDVLTTNATITTLATLSIPAADFGNCYVTIIAECSIAYAAGGGNRCLKATWKRTSGTLAKINETNTSIDGDWTGTVVGGFTTDNPDNDTIRLRGTGISSTNIRWIPNVHIILAKIPS